MFLLISLVFITKSIALFGNRVKVGYFVLRAVCLGVSVGGGSCKNTESCRAPDMCDVAAEMGQIFPTPF